MYHTADLQTNVYRFYLLTAFGPHSVDLNNIIFLEQVSAWEHSDLGFFFLSDGTFNARFVSLRWIIILTQALLISRFGNLIS